MDFTSQIGIFLLGFLLGAGVIAIFAWYINFRKLQQVKNPAEELLALKFFPFFLVINYMPITFIQYIIKKHPVKGACDSF